MKPGKPYQQALNLRSGRNYVLHYHPMSDGGWVTLCEDVTERHRMERELRLQYERFDQAVNHMSHGLCMFGPDERLIVCNAQHLKMYGLDPAVIKARCHAARSCSRTGSRAATSRKCRPKSSTRSARRAVTGRSISTMQLT